MVKEVKIKETLINSQTGIARLFISKFVGTFF